MKQLFIASDHAGFQLKEQLRAALGHHYRVVDCGNTILDPHDDYPRFAANVARESVKHATFGIIICGTAEGVCIAANKIRGARAIAAHTPLLAKLAREHNNANILCLAGGKTVSRVRGLGLTFPTALRIAQTFLTTPFSDKSRHRRRVDQIARLDRER